MNKTDSLGDFMNSFPVLKGIYDSYGKYDLVIKGTNRKFNGFKEMLMYQDIFSSVSFDDETFIQGALPLHVTDPYSEETENPNRPAETCRWANSIKTLTGLDIKPDDSVELKVPELNIEFNRDRYFVGDRWNGPNIDDRRETNVLSYLQNVNYLDYNNCLLKNCYIIGESKFPFITNFTGIGMISDLMNKETLVVWKAEDWKPEFRNGNDVSWDNGKNINKVFEKHFYLNRKARLVHANDLQY